MPDPILTGAIDRVASGDALDEAAAAEVLAEIMEGRADAVQTAGLLMALRTRGETDGQDDAAPGDPCRTAS